MRRRPPCQYRGVTANRTVKPPVAAAGKLLLIDTDGNATVVSGDAEWKVLSTSPLNEACYATPAIAGGCAYIRGETRLYCFEVAS